MRILLTGRYGQLGRCLQDVICSEHELLAFGADELNIADAEQVAEQVAKAQPNLIVNAAAYTAVDKSESNLERAYATNASGPKHLAEAANKLNIPLIHISTDYVFDGQAIAPYLPSDRTNPQGVYGSSKLAGELAVIQTTDQYIILRTAWVFSEYGSNFVKTMIRLAKERDAVCVVADQYGCPTYAGDIALAIKHMCDQYQDSKTLAWGTYHYCGSAPTSWHGFARAIFALAYEQGVIDRKPKLMAISSDQYPTLAKRPEYSVMGTVGLSDLALSPPNWLSSLEVVLKKLALCP